MSSFHSTDGDDTIRGGSGNDRFLYGGAGNDLIEGGGGDDSYLYGEDGDDTIRGGSGNDGGLYGGAGNDLIEGGDGDDAYLFGEDGDDTIRGGIGNDVGLGGAGNDLIEGGGGDDSYLYGEDGDDTIRGGSGNDGGLYGGAGNDLIEGGDGDDTIVLSEGSDTIIGGSGIDHIEGDFGNSAESIVFDLQNSVFTIGSAIGTLQVQGIEIVEFRSGVGDDTIRGGIGIVHELYGGGGNDLIEGGDGGDESLYGDDGDDTIRGGIGNDEWLYGGEGNDLIEGGDGDDYRLYGYDRYDNDDDGDDTIRGGSGNDEDLFGGAGNDLIEGGDGDDRSLYGYDRYDEDHDDDGDDTIRGGSGNDDGLFGGAGNDLIEGGDGHDRSLYGGPGDDTIRGGSGNDEDLYGGAGNDLIEGGDGDDAYLDGYDGDDTIRGGSGNDVGLIGGAGNDLIEGGDGNDALSGGDGNDSLIGGKGDDTLSNGTVYVSGIYDVTIDYTLIAGFQYTYGFTITPWDIIEYNSMSLDGRTVSFSAQVANSFGSPVVTYAPEFFTVPVESISSISGPDGFDTLFSIARIVIGLPPNYELPPDDNGEETPDPVAVSVAIEQAELLEGTGDDQATVLTATITLSEAAADAVTVDFAVASIGDNPADADDFWNAALPSGSITIQAGETVRTVEIRVAADDLPEADETFEVRLTNPRGPATIDQGTATATIRNDDLPPIMVLTHGWVPGGDPTEDFSYLWNPDNEEEDLSRALTDRLRDEYGDDARFLYTSDLNLFFDTDPDLDVTTNVFARSDPNFTSKLSEYQAIFYEYEWNGAISEFSEYLDSFHNTAQAGITLGGNIVELIQDISRDIGTAVNPRLHMVGHSLGTMVNAIAVSQLSTLSDDGTGATKYVDQFTVLDDPLLVGMNDPAVLAIAYEWQNRVDLGEPVVDFFASHLDPSLVHYVENFYATQGSLDLQPPFGGPIPGAGPTPTVIFEFEGLELMGGGQRVEGATHTTIWTEHYRSLIGSTDWVSPLLPDWRPEDHMAWTAPNTTEPTDLELYLDSVIIGVPPKVSEILTGTNEDEFIDGIGGNDTLNGGGGSDYIRGGADDDLIDGGSQADTILGGGGDDTVEGGAGQDYVELGAGSDLFVDNAQSGKNGKDKVYGQTGEDTLLGDGGDDQLFGGDDADSIEGGVGDDELWGGNQADTLLAGDGDDTVKGGSGRDYVELGDGNDLFLDAAQSAGFGRDTVYGNKGMDTILGDGGDDKLYGGNNADYIEGGADNDRLSGGGGTDTLLGGTGSDTINGGKGDDLLSGGSEQDVFAFADGFQIDTITDFEDGLDLIDVIAWSSVSSVGDLTIQDGIEGAEIFATGDASDMIVLEGVSASLIDEADFVFV